MLLFYLARSRTVKRKQKLTLFLTVRLSPRRVRASLGAQYLASRVPCFCLWQGPECHHRGPAACTAIVAVRLLPALLLQCAASALPLLWGRPGRCDARRRAAPCRACAQGQADVRPACFAADVARNPYLEARRPALYGALVASRL